MMKALSQIQQQQAQCGRNRLNEQYFFARRSSAVEAGDKNAAQEEDFDLESAGAQVQTPEQSRRQKPVVQPLVRRQGLRLSGKFLCQTECFHALWLVPQNHLKNENVDMQEANQKHKQISEIEAHWGLGELVPAL